MKHAENLFRRIEKDRRYQIMVVVMIILLGTALRFYRLGEWSLWIDEVFTINRANAHVNVKSLLAAWWHPSMSLLLTRGSMELFGFSPWSARLASALIGILTIPVLYIYTKRWFGVRTAIIAALLLSIAPWHLEWSQTARYYSGQLLFLLLASTYFYQALEQDRPSKFLVAAFFIALAIAERFNAILFFPVAASYLIVLAVIPGEKPAGFNRRNILLLGAPALIFALIEIIRYTITRTSYLIGALDLSYSQPIDDPFRLGLFIVLNIGLPLVAFGAFSGMYLFQKRIRIGIYIALNAFVPVILLLFINPFFFTKDRYVFMVLPFWIILGAFGVDMLFNHMKKNGRLIIWGVFAILVFNAMDANVLYYTVNHGNRNDWQKAFEIVHRSSTTDDQIVIWWTEMGPYYTEKELVFWGDVSSDFIENTPDSSWFLLDEETFWLNKPMKLWLEEEAELVDVIYQRRAEGAFIRIYHYDPAR